MSFAPIDVSNTPNHALDGALHYAEQGLRVVALAPGEKYPTREDWQHKATTEPRSLRALYNRRTGGRNVGLLMGYEIPGRGVLFAVDIDPKNGGSIDDLCRGRPLPPTAKDSTPSGGNHYLFFAPEGSVVTSRTGKIGIRRGVDIIGKDSQIVVEPSVCEDGRWLWITEPHWGIADAPSWLLEEIGAGRPARPSKARTDPETPATRATPIAVARNPDLAAITSWAVGRFPVSGEGRRNSQFFPMVAALIGQGLEDDAIVAVATDWWGHWHGLGLAGAPKPSAILSQIKSGRKAEADGRITGGGNQCHQLALSRLALTPAQKAALKTLINEDLKGRRVRLAGGTNERALMTALLLHFRHEREQGGDPFRREFRATNRQIEELMLARCGVKVSGQNFWSLMRAYLTTDGRPARKVELIRRVFEGRREKGERAGKPSEYELSDRFIELLALGVTDEALPVADVALEALAPAEGPPRPERAKEDRRGPVSEEDDMPITSRIRITRRTEPPQDLLRFPGQKGLLDVLEALQMSGRFGPGEWDEALRWLAHSRADVCKAQT